MASSELKEYIVTLHNHEDLDNFYEDMETPGGDLYIPNRQVDVANRRPISRNTHYFLTQEEAIQLKNDPRVLDVSLTLEELGGKAVPAWTQTGNFTKRSPGRANSDDHNWGLLRGIAGQIPNWPGISGSPLRLTRTISYPLEGLNVDIVIVDGHIQNHPEQRTNPDGTGSSRIQRFDWFSLASSLNKITPTPNYSYAAWDPTDTTLDAIAISKKKENADHGTHVAGTAAGITQGWARKASIYNISVFEVKQLGTTDVYDFIRQWHKTKPINPATGRRNPTILNNSWGIEWPFVQLATMNNYGGQVIYRGQTYNGPWGPTGNPNSISWADFGFNVHQPLTDLNGNSVLRVVPNITFFTADIEDAIRDGIHVVWAAGNESDRQDRVGGPDVDNRITFTVPPLVGIPYYINRSGTLADRAGLLDHVVNVGNLDFFPGGEGIDGTSDRGPGVDIWAPGYGIVSSTVFFGDTSDTRGESLSSYAGTSMASPQVTGFLACLLEAHPTLTPAQAKQYLIDNAKIGEISQTNVGVGLPTDKEHLQGAPNRIMFAPTPSFSITSDKTILNWGQQITFTVNTTNLPNGSLVYLLADGANTNDFLNNQNSVVLTINNNTATWTTTANSSRTGNKTFNVKVFTGQLNGSLQATSSTITFRDTNVSSTYAFRNPFLTLTEGNTVYYTIDTTNVADGSDLYWSIKYNSAIAADFTGDPQGPTTWDNWSTNYNIPASEGIYISQQLYETNNLLGNFGSPSVPFYGLFRKPDSAGVAFWHSEWVKNGKDINAIKSAFVLGIPAGDVDYNRARTNSKSFLGNSNNSVFYDGTPNPITIQNNTGTFGIQILQDNIPEGAETFQIEIRADLLNSSPVLTSPSITISAQSVNAPTYTFTSYPSSINEGSTESFTVQTTNVANGTRLYWTIDFDNSSSTLDFSSINGSFLISGGLGSFNITALADLVTDGTEKFKVEIRTVGVLGTVVAQTPSITINDTSRAVTNPTYAFSAIPSSINEGSSGSFTVQTTDVPNNTTLYWTVKHVSSTSADFNFLDGSFNIVNGLGSFTVSTTIDSLTEGSEAFAVEIRTGSKTGTIVLTSLDITINDTSTNSSTYRFSSVPSSINEGSTGSFNVITTNVPDNTTLYWTLSYTGTNPADAADFVDSFGSISIVNNSGSFQITPVADLTTEAAQTFKAQIRIGGYSGAVVATSSTVTINDTSITPPVSVPSYSFSSTPSSINEGSSGTFNISTTNVPNTTLYWTVNHITTDSADFTAVSGSFSINNGAGNFSVATISDSTTEGAETFTIQIRTGSISGTVVATSSTVTINDTSITPPVLPSTYSFGVIPVSINEGSTGSFNVITTNVPDNTTLYWTINHNTTNSADFTADSGSFNISNNTGSFIIGPLVDSITEGSQTFTVQLRIGGFSGTVVATSSSVTVNDTSLAPVFSSIPTSIVEGSTGTFSITTTNLPDNTLLYWSVEIVPNSLIVSENFNVSVASIVPLSLPGFAISNGAFTIINNLGQFQITPAAGSIANGITTFRIIISTANGTVLATSPNVTIASVGAAPFILTTSSSSISEGSSVTISVYTANLPNGSLVPYTISGTGIDTQDFVGLSSLNGSFRVNNNFGSIQLTLSNDVKTELNETLTLTLTGTGNNESITITILDTSKTVSLANFFVTSPVSVVQEGQIARFDIKATNLQAGTVVPYRILGISQDDLTGGAQLTGFLTFTTGPVQGETYANVTLPILEDFITEGPESIILLLEPTFPYVLQLASTITIKDTAINRDPIYSINTDRIRVFENSNVTFTLTVSNLETPQTIPWEIRSFDPATSDITLGDFSDITALNGVFPPLTQVDTKVYRSNLTLSVRDDLIFEPSEYFYLVIPGLEIFSPVVEIIDSGNTLIISDDVFTGNISVSFLDPAILKANLGSIVTRTGYWEGTTGLISEDMVIQGKTSYATEDSLAFYHPFSYVIRSKISIEEWRDSIKTLLHPAGMTIFSEINNETTFDTLRTLEVKATSESEIKLQNPLTVDDAQVNASTTTIGGANVTVDSLTFPFNF